jgi:hypothetical protein
MRTIALPNITLGQLKKDDTEIFNVQSHSVLPTKFRVIWPIGFRGEDFKKIDQLETRIACGGHVC